MKITVEITRNDYVSFNKFYFFKSGGLKRLVIWTIIAAFGIPIVTQIGEPLEFDDYFSKVILSGIIFFIITSLLYYTSLQRTRNKPFEKGSMLGKKTFIITEEGLIEESDNNKNLQKWAGIKSLEFNKNYIFIFIDKIAAYIIPKRYFKDEIEQETFINGIKNRLINTT